MQVKRKKVTAKSLEDRLADLLQSLRKVSASEFVESVKPGSKVQEILVSIAVTLGDIERRDRIRRS